MWAPSWCAHRAHGIFALSTSYVGFLMQGDYELPTDIFLTGPKGINCYGTHMLSLDGTQVACLWANTP